MALRAFRPRPRAGWMCEKSRRPGPTGASCCPLGDDPTASEYVWRLCTQGEGRADAASRTERSRVGAVTRAVG
jgi:hypothetical protein